MARAHQMFLLLSAEAHRSHIDVSGQCARPDAARPDEFNRAKENEGANPCWPSVFPPPNGCFVGVQVTSLGRDSFSRFICNTWEEAVAPARDGAVSMFDAIVIGGGMYGAYCAHQIWRRGGKVLLLEAGPFFLSEHGQNLARDLGFDAPDAILPTDPQAQVTRKEVWGTPWRGNQIFPGLAFCVGGKSLFWGGWSPRLTDDALSDYPLQAKQWLDKTYERVELQLGVTTLDSTGKTVVTTGFIDETGPGGLTQQLRRAIDKAIVD